MTELIVLDSGTKNNAEFEAVKTAKVTKVAGDDEVETTRFSPTTA